MRTCIAKRDSAVNRRRFDIICDSRFIAYMCTDEYTKICKKI